GRDDPRRGAAPDRPGGGVPRGRAPAAGRRPARRPGCAVRADPRGVRRRGRGAAAGRAVRGLPARTVRRGQSGDARGPARRGGPLRGVPADPGTHDGVGTMKVVVEADGGARGNPGPAGYGAVVRDAGTGEVLAERFAALGTATNNVAEYSGL